MRTWIKRFLRGRRQHTCYLQSPEQFRSRLEIERMRADRSGGLFSLVQFELGRIEGSDSAVAKLDRILESRLRATDDAGLMSPHSIAVLLPETPESGAWRVVEDVLEVYGAQPVRVDVTVHVYSPSDSRNGLARPRSEQVEEPQSEPAGLSVDQLLVQPMPMWKRGLDILGASLFIVVLSPLLLLVGGIVLVSSGRPIIFRQQRTGLGGRPFGMYKFRTMCRDAEARQAALRQFSEQDGPAFKMRNDPRVTSLGRFLRRTSLDELPQFWNVLRGEMSLVGPRPLPCHESNRCTGWQRRRLDVTPGLTCIWQVERTPHVRFADWMRMDLRYARARSFWSDLSLLLRTIRVVLTQRVSC